MKRSSAKLVLNKDTLTHGSLALVRGMVLPTSACSCQTISTTNQKKCLPFTSNIPGVC